MKTNGLRLAAAVGRRGEVKLKRAVEYPEHESKTELNRPTVERNRCWGLAFLNGWKELNGKITEINNYLFVEIKFFSWA